VCDQLLAQEEEGEDFVAEQPFGRRGIDVGDGDEAIVPGPTSPGDEGVDVGLIRSPKVWMTLTMPGRSCRSSTAAAMSSRTVCQLSRASTPRSSRLRKNGGRSILGMVKTHWEWATSSDGLEQGLEEPEQGGTPHSQPAGDRPALVVWNGLSQAATAAPGVSWTE